MRAVAGISFAGLALLSGVACAAAAIARLQCGHSRGSEVELSVGGKWCSAFQKDGEIALRWAVAVPTPWTCRRVRAEDRTAVQPVYSLVTFDDSVQPFAGMRYRVYVYRILLDADGNLRPLPGGNQSDDIPWGSPHWSGPVRERVLWVPHANVIVASLVLPLGWLAVRGRRILAARPRRPAAECHACGYDLRATPTRCPECGTAAPGRSPT